MKKILLALLMLLMGVAAVVANTLDAIAERGELIVAVYQEPLLPFYMPDEAGEWQGFDTDMARDIAATLGVKVRFLRSAKTVDQTLEQVNAGEADVAISALYRTLEREREVLQTRAYLSSPVVLLTKRQVLQKYRGEDLLASLNHPKVTVGGVSNTALQRLGATWLPQAKQVTFPTLAQLIDALQDRDIDVVVAASWYANGVLSQYALLNIYYTAVSVEQVGLITLGLAVSEAAWHWLAWLNLYIEINQANGFFQQLQSKYAMD